MSPDNDTPEKGAFLLGLVAILEIATFVATVASFYEPIDFQKVMNKFINRTDTSFIATVDSEVNSNNTNIDLGWDRFRK